MAAVPYVSSYYLCNSKLNFWQSFSVSAKLQMIRLCCLGWTWTCVWLWAWQTTQLSHRGPLLQQLHARCAQAVSTITCMLNNTFAQGSQPDI